MSAYKKILVLSLGIWKLTADYGSCVLPVPAAFTLMAWHLCQGRSDFSALRKISPNSSPSLPPLFCLQWQCATLSTTEQMHTFRILFCIFWWNSSFIFQQISKFAWHLLSFWLHALSPMYCSDCSWIKLAERTRGAVLTLLLFLMEISEL